MPVSWITYKEKKILFIDLKHLEKEQMLEVIEEQKKIIDKSPVPVLLLNDFTDTFASEEYMDRAKKYGKEQKDKIKKTALVGIQGIKKFLAHIYIQFSGNENTKLCSSMEEAKEYLTHE